MISPLLQTLLNAHIGGDEVTFWRCAELLQDQVRAADQAEAVANHDYEKADDLDDTPAIRKPLATSYDGGCVTHAPGLMRVDGDNLGGSCSRYYHR